MFWYRLNCYLTRITISSVSSFILLKFRPFELALPIIRFIYAHLMHEWQVEATLWLLELAILTLCFVFNSIEGYTEQVCRIPPAIIWSRADSYVCQFSR